MNELDTATLIAIEEEIKYISQNIEYFIDEYGYIEDKDNGTGKAKFKLWDEQKKVLREIAENRLNIILKARQLGITWLSLWFALFNMIFSVGYTVVALSKRDDDAKELVHRMEFMLENLPKWLIIRKKDAQKGHKGIMWEATAHEIEIFRENEENSRFIAMPSARDSGRSFTASLVILDEWAFQQWAEEIWTAAYPTVNRPTGGKVIGLSTAKRMTLFEKIWKQYQDFGFHRIFLSWRADPRRTDEWYEGAKKALAAGQKYLQEYPNTPEEAFSAGEGTSFPEFSKDIHVCKPFKIPEHWRKWRCGDNGYTDPFWFGWLTVSEDGQVFLYREFTRSPEEERITYSEQAKKVVELSKYTEIEHGVLVEKEEKIDFTVIGVDAWNKHHRDQTGKSIVDYYNEGGLTDCIKAITDRKLRKATLHEYLKPYFDKNTGKWTAKLQIFDTCKAVIKTLPELINDEKDPEKVADCEIDHPYDGLGYGLIAYHVQKSKPVENEKTEIQKHKEKLARRLKNARKKRRIS
jgi:hypothetical protein